MSTQTETPTETKLDDGVPDCWPPVVHLIRWGDYPAKKGTIALCGAKLMGIEWKGHVDKACIKCEQIWRRGLA